MSRQNRRSGLARRRAGRVRRRGSSGGGAPSSYEIPFTLQNVWSFQTDSHLLRPRASLIDTRPRPATDRTRAQHRPASHPAPFITRRSATHDRTHQTPPAHRSRATRHNNISAGLAVVANTCRITSRPHRCGPMCTFLVRRTVFDAASNHLSARLALFAGRAFRRVYPAASTRSLVFSNSRRS